MNNAEIQIQFPQPGQWGDFTLTAIYRDADGYTRTDRYKQEDLPTDQAPAMEAVVTALVGLAEPWKAVQVWARLDEYVNLVRHPDEPASGGSVCLTVEVINDQGGRRTFTSCDYPEFAIQDPAAVAFFKYFVE